MVDFYGLQYYRFLMDFYGFLWISMAFWFLHLSGLPSILYMKKLNNNWTRFSGAKRQHALDWRNLVLIRHARMHHRT